MKALENIVTRTSGLHDRMAEAAGIVSPAVYCTVCGASKMVDGAQCLRSGWPKCHGFTMTLDKHRAGPAVVEGGEEE